MSKVVIAGDASGTGTFTISAPNGNTDRTLVLPDEAGTIITSGSPTVLPKGVPAFHVYRTTDATGIGVNVDTKIILDGTLFAHGATLSSGDVTPSVAGYYYVTGVTVLASASSSAYIQSSIRKNGTLSFSNNASTGITGSMYPRSGCSVLLYMNGTTDYLSLYSYGGASTYVSLAGYTQTYMAGYLVRAD